MTPTPYTRSADLLNKVPEVTLAFWAVKILATTVGETGADLLGVTLDLGLTQVSVVMGVGLAAALSAQMLARTYIPWLYWLTVVLVSVVGTLITDNLTDNFGVSLFLSTSLFAVALAATFAAWYGTEETLSIHTIHSRRREAFYWAAILFTFALGTAAGDLLAERLELGFAFSAVAFGTMIAIVAMCHFGLGLNAILAFWLAYILTRPFGASMGDLLAQPVADGGHGLGTVATSVAFLAVIAGLVARESLIGRAAAALPRPAEG